MPMMSMYIIILTTVPKLVYCGNKLLTITGHVHVIVSVNTIPAALVSLLFIRYLLCYGNYGTAIHNEETFIQL